MRLVHCFLLCTRHTLQQLCLFIKNNTLHTLIHNKYSATSWPTILKTNSNILYQNIPYFKFVQRDFVYSRPLMHSSINQFILQPIFVFEFNKSIQRKPCAQENSIIKTPEVMRLFYLAVQSSVHVGNLANLTCRFLKLLKLNNRRKNTLSSNKMFLVQLWLSTLQK